MTDERLEPTGEPGYRIEPEFEPHVDPNAPPLRGHRLVPYPDLAAALARTAALDAQYRSLASEYNERVIERDAAEARVRELIAAGDRLAEGYAAHDDDCPYPYKSVVTDDDCTCGLNAARDAWERAKEKEQP